jgi:uncharacterized repeat protein (TIGR01451 family)
MSITKTADKKIVHSGDLVTYTITTYNNGSATFTDNAISDVLPAGMKFVSSDR